MTLHLPCIRGVAICLLIMIAGCVQHRPLDDLSRQAVAFMKPGTVSEEELLLHFGTPTFSYDNERILTWRMGRSSLNYDELTPAMRPLSAHSRDRDTTDWQGTKYDLVVVLDGHRRLQRFSLLPVHGE
ncbi:MAG TPA: hypothetical protein VFE47_23785 [Tepidisphaeraceae bacterium]|jgi:hypothetical protein|nr:hypothetical protein [Tepidisphaeraceae bacterium]